MNKKIKEFLCGMKWGIPIALGYIPVGITYAIMARSAGFSFFEIVGMSFFVFAGASQMMVTGMYAGGASIIVMIITTFVMNLRHFIMGTCIMNQMTNGSLPARILVSFGVTDESFAVYTMQRKERCTIFTFAGLVVCSYSSWVLSGLLGALVSSVLPEMLSKSMAISLYAMFIAMVVPNIRGNMRLGILICLTAAVNSVLTFLCSLISLNSSWALIASTLICAFIGVFFVKDKEDAHEN